MSTPAHVQKFAQMRKNYLARDLMRCVELNNLVWDDKNKVYFFDYSNSPEHIGQSGSDLAECWISSPNGDPIGMYDDNNVAIPLSEDARVFWDSFYESFYDHEDNLEHPTYDLSVGPEISYNPMFMEKDFDRICEQVREKRTHYYALRKEELRKKVHARRQTKRDYYWEKAVIVLNSKVTPE